MLFKNREQAGKLLSASLSKYKNEENAIVLGLPRGGVVTAYALAHNLNLPLDVIVIRKVGAPFNPELAIGAISSTGKGYLNQDLIDDIGVEDDYLEKTIEAEKKVAQHRLDLYRQNKPEISLKDKTVILVDDGLATGATMKAAIQSVRNSGAKKIIVAVPVAPPHTIKEIEEDVDEIIVLDAPSHFMAVGQFYEDFSQTEDDEVIELLKKVQRSE